MELKESAADAILSLDHDSVIDATRFLNSNRNSVDINYLRHKLLPPTLPPTLVALSLHLQRANYQSHIWRSACIPILDLPSPEGNGWSQCHGCLELERMIDDAVPDVVVELTRCKCNKGCRTNSCSCRRAKLTCAEVFHCNYDDECENLQQFETNPSSDEEY